MKYFGIFRHISLWTTAIIKICKFTVFSSGSFCQIYRVTDEALIAETMLWPNFFLMNVFFALKGSKLFIIINYIDYAIFFHLVIFDSFKGSHYSELIYIPKASLKLKVSSSH